MHQLLAQLLGGQIGLNVGTCGLAVRVRLQVTTDHVASAGCVRAKAADVRLQSEVVDAMGTKRENVGEFFCWIMVGRC